MSAEHPNPSQTTEADLVRSLHDHARFIVDAAGWLQPTASEILGKRGAQLHDLAGQVERHFEQRTSVIGEDMSADGGQDDHLRRAITEHRTAIHNAGPIRVDSRDVPIADAKQKADERLWSVLR